MDAAALAAALKVCYTSLPLFCNDFQLRFFAVVSVAARHALTSVKAKLFFSDYVTTKCLF